MAKGVSGYIDFDASVAWGKVRVNYEETYEVTTNKSTLTLTSIQVKSTKWFGVGYYLDGVLKINGVEVLRLSSSTGNASVDVQAKNTWYTVKNYATGVETTAFLSNIVHANDGSKSINIELTGNRFTGFRFFTQDGGSDSGWYVNDYKTVKLTTIPRASDIGATDANIGSRSSVVINKKASTYTHSIQYKFGTLSGYITQAGEISKAEVKFSATNVAFYIPESFYAQIPQNRSGKCKLTCTTYSGTLQIGSATTEFTVTAAESNCKPSVEGTVVDSNPATIDLTGSKDILVKYFSIAHCTMLATAKQGANIVTKKIAGAIVVEDYRIIPEVESGSITFHVEDSRGYSASFTVEKKLVNYTKLTSNVQLNRNDPTSGDATLTVRGNYFNKSFGAVNNSLEIKYRVAKSGEPYGDWKPLTAIFSGDSYSVTATLTGLDYLNSYSVQVQCQDKLMTKTATATVSQGIPVVDWGANDFRFNVPFLIPAGSYGPTLPKTGKAGQVFFLQDSNGTYSIRIHNGVSW